MFSPLVGFLLYSLLIAGCLISLSEIESLNHHGKMVIALTILPIIRVTELFIKLASPLRTIIVYWILIFLVIFYSRKFKINPGYTKKRLYFLPLTILIGIIIGVAGNWLFGFDAYPGIFLILPLMAFSEEVLFRGLIQNLIKKTYGVFSSIFFTALFYGIFSLSLGLGFAVFMFAANLIISAIYNKTGNIWLTMSMNASIGLLLFTGKIF